MFSPFACALCLLLALGLPALAQPPALASAQLDMTALPDESGAWERIGSGHAFLMDDGLLAVNDNSNAERIAFQTLLADIRPEHELVLRARLRVISNVGGGGSTIELGRPGLEVVVRLFPDHLVVGERDAGGDFHWLGQCSAALDELGDLEIRKLAAVGGAGESVLLLRDGVQLLQVPVLGLGQLGVGRVLFGSLSNHDMGATIFDWIQWEQRAVVGRLPVVNSSFGELKARFRD